MAPRPEITLNNCGKSSRGCSGQYRSDLGGRFHLCSRISEPPQEVLDFWQAEYRAMTTIAGNIKLAEEAGYEVFDHFTLPRSAWWDEYLTPLAKRVRQLQPEASQNPALAEVLAAMEQEIGICDRFGDCFGYVFI